MNFPHVLIACGSFNPITVMHTRMFELARHHLKTKKNIPVERGIISPTNDCYAVIKPSLTPAHHRLAMIKLALKDAESHWISYDSWETEQKTWIRTLPALRHYETVYGKNLKLLCGADLIDSFLVPDLWADEHIEEILRSYGIVVIPRPGSNPWKLLYDSPKSEIFKRNLNQIDIIGDYCPLELSSTMVRDAVKEGKPINQLVHGDVASYIYNNANNASNGHELNRQYYRRFLHRNPQIFRLVSHEKLCRVEAQKYVICPEFCCGEFWESKPQFCCTSNFEPIRNLFYFLAAAFVALLVTVAIFLVVENIIKHRMLSRLKQLQAKYNLSVISGMLTLNKDLISSDDTSLEEDSSSADAPAHRLSPISRSKPAKQLLKMHSQNFKDMLKLQSSKRVKNTYKSALTRAPKSSKSLKSVIDAVESGKSKASPGSATSPESLY